MIEINRNKSKKITGINSFTTIIFFVQKIGTLRGPLHGGANEAAMQMLGN